MNASQLLRATASLAAPPRCGICGEPCDWRHPACPRCLAALRALTPARRAIPGFDAVAGAATYAGAARELVAALKFGPRPRLAGLAAAAMATAMRTFDLPAAGATVVPVPPAPRRLRRRGFDPAEAISTVLARELGLPLDRCLVRASGPRQVGRARRDRLASPPRVRCAGSPPSRAVLADDVFTTGATLAACARALRAAGCEEVVALVFAIASPGGRASHRRRGP